MKSKRTARLLAALLSAFCALAIQGPVAAQADPTKPGYSEFSGCPTKAQYPAVEFCVRAEIKSGNFKMGNKNVPITKPIILSGGVVEDLSGFKAGPTGGLSEAKQLVPGGVIGLTGLDWLVNFLNIEALQLYAVTELAGTPNLSNPESTTLPIKVHLINPVLGSKCYVGSNASPINLNLITGTTSPPPPNKPISGKGPEIAFEPVRTILEFKNIKYVDNSFSAPGANGCTLTLFGFIPVSINGLVNTASGLPSAAGNNETVQNTDLKSVYQPLVY
jgi:hypothetical protein